MKRILLLVTAGFTLIASANPKSDISINGNHNCVALTFSRSNVTSFSGSLSGTGAILQWSVKDNEESYRYELEKSEDGNYFTPAALIFSSEKKGEETYLVKDKSSDGLPVYYRIRIIATDSTYSYSTTLRLTQPQTEKAGSVRVLGTAGHTLQFTYESEESLPTVIHLYDRSGKKIFISQLQSIKGTLAVTLPLARSLPAGKYVLELSNAVERTAVGFQN